MSNFGSASMWKERPNEKSDGAVEFASQSMANLHPFMDSSLINRIDEGGSRLSRIIRPMSQLQDIATELKLEGCDLELPQIVVIGSQSSGKTSVLESISGEEMFPRGTDIQSRCPIILQLVNNLPPSAKWVEFLHDKDKRYTNMSDVRAEIVKMNKKIKEIGQFVTSDPITLKLFSPAVPNLILVALPNLVENPLIGEPEDIKDRVHKLVLKHIKNPKCIILAITGANTDIADSKAIQLARQVDPYGHRTLAVLTKLDLMEPGTNYVEELLGKKIKMSLGAIGVVNRSYLEVREGKSLSEQHFLQAKCPALAHCNGTPYLIKKIGNLLMDRINDFLPSVKNYIEEQIDIYKAQLENGEEEDLGQDKICILYSLLAKFGRLFSALVDKIRTGRPLKPGSASANIKKVLDSYLGMEFDNLGAANQLSDEELDIVIQNLLALNYRDEEPNEAFQEIAEKEVKTLRKCAEDCAKEVCKELRKAVDSSVDASTKLKYPSLYQKIKQVALELIAERFEDCQKYLSVYLDTRSFTISITDWYNDIYSRQHSNRELMNSNEFFVGGYHRATLKRDIQVYFYQTKLNIMRHVRQRILLGLVYGTSNQMTSFMITRLHNAESAEALLICRSEDQIIAERARLEIILGKYKEAYNVIQIVLSNNAAY